MNKLLNLTAFVTEVASYGELPDPAVLVELADKYLQAEKTWDKLEWKKLQAFKAYLKKYEIEA